MRINPRKLLAFLPAIFLAATGETATASAAAAAAVEDLTAHRSGCHKWHSCPSDSGAYICGDAGRCRFCPDNRFCLNGRPRPSAPPSAPSRPEAPAPGGPQLEELKTAPPWHDENAWVRANCPGEAERVNIDNTRADCATSRLVIEVDFPGKWAECHGQAIRYQRVNPGLRGACWLLCGRPGKGACAQKAEALKLDAAKTGILIQCRSWATGDEVDCRDH